MTTTEVYEKPKLSCKSRGPGPAYNLPTLVGYNDHDPSRHRNPAYSLRKRLDSKGETVGPGPDYNVYHLTEKGLDKPLEFTIAGRAPFKVIGFGPGPGAYNPEKCPPMNHSKRPPAYSLKSRWTNKYDNSGPGPNAYTVPTCLGPSIPDKRAFGAFTITGLRSQEKKYVGPSPAHYTKLNYDVIKKKTPAYSMKYRHDTLSKSFGPGPQYYPLYNTKKSSPQFSFGVKHSDCASPARVELDDLED